MRNLAGLCVVAVLLALAGTGFAQESQPAAPAANQGPTYEQFQAGIAQMPQMWAMQMAKRYELDDQQKQAVLQSLQQRTAAFLRDSGPAMFEVITQGQEMFRQVAQSGGKWSDVPEETRKQMADKGMAVMDLLQKQATEFMDEVKPTLRPEQQQKLDEDRAAIQQQLDRGKERLQAIAKGESPAAAPPAGQTLPPPGSPDAGAQTAAAAPRQSAGAGQLTLDILEQMVQQFIALHKLDEVQKVQAMDILKKYQEKAKVMLAAERPAEPTASKPSEEEMTKRAGERQQRFRGLLVQMKAELDQIPTPVQKQLAGTAATSAPSSRPAAQTQPQAK